MLVNQITKSNNHAPAACSRRNFIQHCAVGVAALSSGTLLSSLTGSHAVGKKGGAGLRFSLNQNWLFGGKFTEEALSADFDDKAFNPVTVPHTVAVLSWQDWDEKKWEDSWIYRRHFTIPEYLKGFRLFLHFDGVMVCATPSINGYRLPEHQGGYLPFKYEITDRVQQGQNVLAVKVDSRWSNVPPAGSKRGAKDLDFLEVGGIHRPVSLEAVPQLFVSDVFAKPVDVLKTGRRIEIKCTIDSALTTAKTVKVNVEMLDHDKVIAQTEKALTLDKAGQTESDLTLTGLSNLTLWDVDNPKLYDIITTVSAEGYPIHNYRTRIGLREAKFELDGFFLNGRRLRLFGLNRHEVYPYTGYAMPGRVIRKDAEMLKNLFNCNMVRCSHYPQNEDFFEACDELGLLVWEEIPGWWYIGDEEWKALLLQNVKDMVTRDRNHPSIIIWGTRVNESANEVELYHKTRALAKKLDDSRPTSGSMTPWSLKNRQRDWHEDVFAYDDYHAEPDGSVGILKAIEGYPYFLAETVGQCNYRDPKHLMNAFYRRTTELKLQQMQAVVHAQAHHKAAADPHNSGVLAWCAFDYSSLGNHYRAVKYPGVADVFRIPKLGAAFYMSQGDPKREAVIHPDFYWDFGAKSPDGPGKNVAIFSNCDHLKLAVDGKEHGMVKPDITNYGNLKHPPFFVDLEFIDSKPTELRIDGYLNGAKVCSRTFSADVKQDQFLLMADDKEIVGDGSDATRIIFRIADKFNAPRPFAEGKVDFEIAGPGTIVGDNPFNLTESGGTAAVWVKGRANSRGSIVLKATHEKFGSKKLTINVKAASRKKFSI